jgi:hypothetical protein
MPVPTTVAGIDQGICLLQLVLLSIEYLAKVGLGHVVPRLFDALHLLYEDLKLEVASAEDISIGVSSRQDMPLSQSC